MGDVDGMAAHRDLEPHDADLARSTPLARGLGDQRRVGPVAALQAGERAVAGEFLLDHRLDEDVGGRLEAGPLQRFQGEQAADPARLHVAGAAAVHPAVLDDRIEGRGRPHLVRAFRHDVDMAVDDQRASLRLARRRRRP